VAVRRHGSGFGIYFCRRIRFFELITKYTIGNLGLGGFLFLTCWMFGFFSTMGRDCFMLCEFVILNMCDLQELVWI